MSARLFLLFASITLSTAHSAPSPKDWVGLWQAELAFGPEAKGALLLRDNDDTHGWQAEIAGYAVPVKVDGKSISFTLPDDQGSFRGTRVADGEIHGIWTQPPTVQGGGQRYASPVLLRQVSPGVWLGTLRPLNDHLSFYLPVAAGEGDTVTAWLMNPERNLGKFLDVTRLERTEDDSVKLIGKPFNAKAEKVISTGDWDSTDQKLRIYIPWHGDYYAMTRADSLTNSPFYARGKNPAPYTYRAPPALPDGWPVADAEAVGLSRPDLERMVQFLIDIPLTDVHSSQVHAVLVARHGKLVLEEYFHGFHRDLPHETRSAAKSFTATLVGAAMQAGAPLGLDSPVYATMAGHREGNKFIFKFDNKLEKRKRAIQVQHLLTQSTGLDCDDSDNNSAGNEDKVQQESKEPDWWKLTLGLKTVRDPGEKAVYCSMQPNLLGGVLKATTGEPLPELFDRLIAQPLGMRRYHLPLTPTGDAYMGGGVHILPRDFMKFGQMMLNGGVWQGHRVLSPEFAADAITPRYDLSGIQYGYLWWSIEFPYQNKKVRAFFAGGNGGQMVMGIPELDLVVVFLGGNYSDKGTFRAQREFVPQLLLPAVR